MPPPRLQAKAAPQPSWNAHPLKPKELLELQYFVEQNGILHEASEFDWIPEYSEVPLFQYLGVVPLFGDGKQGGTAEQPSKERPYLVGLRASLPSRPTDLKETGCLKEGVLPELCESGGGPVPNRAPTWPDDSETFFDYAVIDIDRIAARFKNPERFLYVFLDNENAKHGILDGRSDALFGPQQFSMATLEGGAITALMSQKPIAPATEPEPLLLRVFLPTGSFVRRGTQSVPECPSGKYCDVIIKGLKVPVYQRESDANSPVRQLGLITRLRSTELKPVRRRHRVEPDPSNPNVFRLTRQYTRNDGSYAPQPVYSGTAVRSIVTPSLGIEKSKFRLTIEEGRPVLHFSVNLYRTFGSGQARWPGSWSAKGAVRIRFVSNACLLKEGGVIDRCVDSRVGERSSALVAPDAADKNPCERSARLELPPEVISGDNRFKFSEKDLVTFNVFFDGLDRIYQTSLYDRPQKVFVATVGDLLKRDQSMTTQEAEIDRMCRR